MTTRTNSKFRFEKRLPGDSLYGGKSFKRFILLYFTLPDNSESNRYPGCKKKQAVYTSNFACNLALFANEHFAGSREITSSKRIEIDPTCYRLT